MSEFKPSDQCLILAFLSELKPSDQYSFRSTSTKGFIHLKPNKRRKLKKNLEEVARVAAGLVTQDQDREVNIVWDIYQGFELSATRAEKNPSY